MRDECTRAGARAPASSDWRDEIEQAIEDAERDAKRLPPSYRDTLMPNGELVLLHFEDVVAGNVAGSMKWLAIFRIVGDRRPILRAYNVPSGRRLSPQSALSVDFRNITGLAPLPVPRASLPGGITGQAKYRKAETRRARLYLGAFLLDCEVEGRTHVVSRRMDRERREWVTTDASEHYSVVDLLVRRTAGSPPLLQRRRRGRE